MRTLSQPVKFDQYRGENKFTFRGVTYERKGLLGEGTTAAVYRFDPPASVASASAVAVKVEHGRKYRGVERFEEGISFFIDAYWNDQIYGLGVLSGDPRNEMKRHYFLMPYFAGILACDILLHSTRELIEWFIMVANFIHEKMHREHGAVHGDIKIDNVIFQSAEKKVYVIDFGLTEKMGDKIGRYEPPVKCDPILGIKKISPNEVCPQTAPELFGRELVPADSSQDAYGLGYFLSSLLKKTRGASPAEVMKIGLVIASLRAPQPKQRCSIPSAISTLHGDFVSTVPRLLPSIDKLTLFRQRRPGISQKEDRVVASEIPSLPPLTKAMADNQLRVARCSF